MSETKTLQYRIDGPPGAPLVVLGPALGTTWHMWDRQIPELSRYWRVMRFDLPGHGGAPARPAAAVPELADRLLAAVDSVGADGFAYAGCSLGGAVGVQLALNRSERVTSLALVSSSPRYATPDAWRQRGVVVRTNGLDPIARAVPERWFTPEFAAAQPAIIEWAVQMVRTTDPGCYIAACEALAAFDARAELGRITVPTLVVAGAEDQVTPPGDARALVAGVPDARLALVPGVRHLIPVERPGEVTDLLVHHFATGRQGPVQAAPVQPASSPAPGRPASHASRTPPDPSAPPASPAAPDAAGEEAWQGGAVAALTAGGSAHSDVYGTGERVRREVLGDAHVDREAETAGDALADDFRDFTARHEWGGAWSRPGIDRRTRSVVTLTVLAAGGHLEELVPHTRAALRNGLTPEEIKEVLLHAGVYCGLPAANAAFAVARRVIREETTPRD